MRFNFKTTVAAVAMVAAGSAQADLTGFNAINGGLGGSVALYAFNTKTGNYYVRDTGFLLNSFVPNSVTTLTGDGGITGDKTPSTGLTLDKVSTTSFSDTAFSLWYSGQTVTDVFWALVGGDSLSAGANGVSRVLTTGAANGLALTDGQVTNAVAGANIGNLKTLTGTMGLSTSSNMGAPAWMSTNGGLNTLTQLGQGASLYYAARSAQSGSSILPANVTEFANGAGSALVTLAVNGDLSYVLAPEAVGAVPVPAAAWLLGTGLMAMGGMARRRRASEKA